jgi:C4-dicarboxylate-specific signal transduction histidine kinase
VKRLPSQLYAILPRPVTASDDSRRREFILNILLIASMVLALIAFTVDAIHALEPAQSTAPHWKLGPAITFGTFCFFFVLFKLSRAKLIGFSAYALIGVYYLAATFAVCSWSIDLPQALLTYAVTITLSGVLGTARAAAITTFLVIATLLIVLELSLRGLLHPELAWTNEPIRLSNAIVYGVSFLVIFFVSWLSKREIDHSLLRARRFEGELLEERDLLEETVERRTGELRQLQQVELSNLYEMVELGRLSSSLLHDLLNPLTTVALTLEQFQSEGTPELIARAMRNTKKIERFVETARKQIRRESVQAMFSAADAAADVIELLADKLANETISISLESFSIPYIHGDQAKFERLLANLLGNAIDAYDGLSRPYHEIKVSLSAEQAVVVLRVRDHGKGISSDTLAQAFEPFFTTKPVERGTGIGLTICKEIVEQDFKGKIEIFREREGGTTVQATLLTHAS